MFVIMLCALRLTNIGLVQCLRVGSLWNFARVGFLCFACFASQTPGLPCSARTLVPFGILHACVYVLRASPRKHRVCAVLFPRPLFSLYACVCHVLPQKHRICAVLFSRFPFKTFVRLCFSRFVMRISLTNIGFVQCLSLGPLLGLYAYLCRVMLCVLRLKNISFVRSP